MVDKPNDLIRKVEEHICSGPFTETEMAAFREMVQAWRGLLILGKAAKWVIVSLGLIAALVASLGAIREALRGWLA